MSTRNWTPAPSVAAGLSQATIHWPKRSTSPRARDADGIIGDARHQAEPASDHNPDERGIVHAFDLTHAPEIGVDCHVISERIRGHHDHRVRYVIFDRRIFLGPWSGGVQRGDREPWLWVPYTGTSPHTEHMHVSIGYDPSAEDDVSDWYAPGRHLTPPTLQFGDHGIPVEHLQVALVIWHRDHHNGSGVAQHLKPTGRFDLMTQRVVMDFQVRLGLNADGIVGPRTWAKLGLST
jgi:peptidoglycan hydrolase-like protein with peptidoglycan-binding domain